MSLAALTLARVFTSPTAHGPRPQRAAGRGTLHVVSSSRRRRRKGAGGDDKEGGVDNSSSNGAAEALAGLGAGVEVDAPTAASLNSQALDMLETAGISPDTVGATAAQKRNAGNAVAAKEKLGKGNGRGNAGAAGVAVAAGAAAAAAAEAGNDGLFAVSREDVMDSVLGTSFWMLTLGVVARQAGAYTRSLLSST